MMADCNAPKPGYIFIPAPRANHRGLPSSYVDHWCGSIGYWAKLDPESCNGWSPISRPEYEQVPL